jgi:hypothetical protein
VQHVVMIVPEYADVDEAERVGEQDGQAGGERSEIAGRGDAEIQHHDGDGDGEDAVGEGFETLFAHGCVERGTNLALLLLLAARWCATLESVSQENWGVSGVAIIEGEGCTGKGFEGGGLATSKAAATFVRFSALVFSAKT